MTSYGDRRADPAIENRRTRPYLRGLSEYGQSILLRLCRKPSVAALLVGSVAVAATVAVYGRNPPTRLYVTAPVERGTIKTSVEATGHIEAVGTVDVSSQISGQIAKVFVGFNDVVKSGQPLAELDRGIFEAQVNEAEAAVAVALAKVQVRKSALDRAKLAVERARADGNMARDQGAGAQAHQREAEQELARKLELTRSGSASTREVDRARAARDTAVADTRAAFDQMEVKRQAAAMADVEVQMAVAELANAEAGVAQRRAALVRAQLDLDRTVLRSPIDGVIVKRDVEPGQTVAVALETKTLFTIAADLHRMEVHGKIDEADVGKIKVGETAHFTVDAYPEKSFTGSVLQLRTAPESKEGVVAYTAVISAENRDLQLLPGMTAMLRIVGTPTGPLLKVPLAALHFKPAADAPLASVPPDNAGTLWVLGADGRPTPVAAKVGFTDDNTAEIRSGALSQGQQVIVGVARPLSNTASARLRFGL